MITLSKQINGLAKVDFKQFVDERGTFSRAFCSRTFRDAGIQFECEQQNISTNERSGILRGMHMQQGSFAEAKFVRCIKGSILDVAVDLRSGSETFGCWESVELSEENNLAFYIPRGFAHGYITLSNASTVFYSVDNFYHKPSEIVIDAFCPELKIAWPDVTIVRSHKDQSGKTLREYLNANKII